MIVRKVILYIAMSLGGYITDQHGRIDWLHGDNPTDEKTESYHHLLKHVDSVIMSETAFRMIEEKINQYWIRQGLKIYVLSSLTQLSSDHVIVTSEDICSLVQKIKQGSGKDIWICGGQQLITPLIQANMIDEYHISMIPTLIGKGTRLFEDFDQETRLSLIKSYVYNGIVDIEYQKKY